MFGVYENFPEMRHGLVQFSSTASAERLQRAIVWSLYRSNQSGGDLSLPEFAQYNIEASLEFGLADGVTFNYIDREILERCYERLRKDVFQMLDFLCIARYYVTGEEGRRPLRFDYYMLRFVFHKKEVELRVYHEKGTRRLPIEDLVSFLMDEINKELARRRLRPVRINHKHAL